MKMKVVLGLFVIAILMSSCLFSKKNAGKDEANVDLTESELRIDKLYMQVDDTQDYVLNKIELKDSILIVTVNYKGESGEDAFELIFNGMYAKSMPPIATLFLVQKTTGDKEITKELKFNVSKAKYYKGEKTIIKVKGWDERFTLLH